MPQKRKEEDEEIVGRPVPRRYAQHPNKARRESPDDRDDEPSRRPVAQRREVHNRLRNVLRDEDDTWEEL